MNFVRYSDNCVDELKWIDVDRVVDVVVILLGGQSIRLGALLLLLELFFLLLSLSSVTYFAEPCEKLYNYITYCICRWQSEQVDITFRILNGQKVLQQFAIRQDQ